MVASGESEVDRLIAGLAGDNAQAHHALSALLDAWDEPVTEALLHALRYDPNATLRRHAATAFWYQPASWDDERVVVDLLGALDDADVKVRMAAITVLYQIAFHNRTARLRIVEKLDRLAETDPWEKQGAYPLREWIGHLVEQLGPSIEEIQETQGEPFPPEQAIADLQSRLDAWVATIYDSQEERRRVLHEMLAPYDRRPTVKAVALSRLLDRLTYLVEIVGPLEGDAAETVNFYDRAEAGMIDTREGRTGERDKEEPAPHGSREFIGEREFEYAHGYYPRWLKRDLIDDALPWDAAQVTTLERFLDEYTLHDSLVVGLWLDPANGVTLIVRWDPIWVNYEAERIDFWPEARMADVLAELRWGGDVAFWPFLIIHFDRVCHLWENRDSSAEDKTDSANVYSATSGVLTEERRRASQVMTGADLQPQADASGDDYEPVPADAHETAVFGRQGYELRLVHAALVSVLCLNRAGVLLHIPGLDTSASGDKPSVT